MERGAKTAHQACRDFPEEAAPARAVLDPNENHLSVTPYAKLSCEVGKWKELWGAGGAECCPDLDAWDEVPRRARMSSALLREVSSSFKANTAAVDGYHPRHFSWLSCETLEVVGRFFEVFEAMGDFPKTTASLLVALLPKPNGDTRPIGLYRSLYRVWAKATAKEWREWERNHDAGHIFEAGEGRAAADVAWRQAFRAEGGVTSA